MAFSGVLLGQVLVLCVRGFLSLFTSLSSEDTELEVLTAFLMKGLRP